MLENAFKSIYEVYTMSNKMTKRNYFEMIKASFPVDNEHYAEVMDFCDRELDLLSRKNASKKATATQEANAKLADVIAAYLAENRGEKFTISALIADVEELAGLSNQKVTGVMRILLADGRAEKVVEKRVTYFTAC